jgi:hypothetical protein
MDFVLKCAKNSCFVIAEIQERKKLIIRQHLIQADKDQLIENEKSLFLKINIRSDLPINPSSNKLSIIYGI